MFCIPMDFFVILVMVIQETIHGTAFNVNLIYAKYAIINLKLVIKIKIYPLFITKDICIL